MNSMNALVVHQTSGAFMDSMDALIFHQTSGAFMNSTNVLIFHQIGSLHEFYERFDFPSNREPS